MTVSAIHRHARTHAHACSQNRMTGRWREKVRSRRGEHQPHRDGRRERAREREARPERGAGERLRGRGTLQRLYRDGYRKGIIYILIARAESELPPWDTPRSPPPGIRIYVYTPEEWACATKIEPHAPRGFITSRARAGHLAPCKRTQREITTFIQLLLKLLRSRLFAPPRAHSLCVFRGISRL